MDMLLKVLCSRRSSQVLLRIFLNYNNRDENQVVVVTGLLFSYSTDICMQKESK